MQKDYRNRMDYVRLGINKLDFSSLEYLKKCLENNPYVDVTLPGNPNLLKLPFCSAFLVNFDSWAFHLTYSNAHRRLMESMEFAGSIKSFVRWMINSMISGYKENVNLDDLSLYSSVYEKLFGVHAPLQCETVKRLLNPKKNETILEIGCATGNLCHLLADDVKEVTGIDHSKSYIKRAIKKAKKLGLRNCKFINAEYPYNFGKKFDYTIAFNLGFLGEKEYRGHLFPSKEVLFGAFIGGEDIENEQQRVMKIIRNFEKNYEIHSSDEKLEELGEFMYLSFLHMKRRS